jgi:AcrR family transcriptional regulator
VKEYNVRYNEILDCAQNFFFTQGYEQTSIQMIIDEVGIAKGTFYHYFHSKEELLDGVIERMLYQTLEMLAPMMEDDQLNSLEKFNYFVNYLNNWSLDNITFFKEVMKVYFQEENALFREKINQARIHFTVPLLGQIIRQGIEEGNFETDDPELMAEIIIEMGQPLSRSFADLVMNADQTGGNLAIIRNRINGYHTAIERVLAAQPGSLKLIDFELLKKWL